MSQRLITAEEVIEMNSCYSDEKIRENHGPDGITVDQIIALNISRVDV